MTKPILIAVCRVKDAKEINPQKGKPFLSVNTEMQPEEYNGKTYSTRVEVRVRWKYDELDLQPGEWIAVQGQAKTEPFEYNGKNYSKLICDAATVTRIAVASQSEEDQPPPTSSRKTTQQELPASPAKPPVEEDDSVPF